MRAAAALRGRFVRLLVNLIQLSLSSSEGCKSINISLCIVRKE